MSKIKVIGIGNLGFSVIYKMISLKLKEFDYIEISTWGAHINNLKYEKECSDLKNEINLSTFLLGEKIGNGVLGNGVEPSLAGAALEESNKELNMFLKKNLENADTAFIITALGDATGPEVAPNIVKRIKKMGITTIGIFRNTFTFEGKRFLNVFEKAITKFKEGENINKIVLLNSDDFWIKNKSIVKAYNNVEEKIVSIIKNY